MDDRKDVCDDCAAPITWVESAYACDTGCTFCVECHEGLDGVCPNCSMELRPTGSRARPVGR